MSWPLIACGEKMKYQNLPELAQAECGLVLLELRMPSSGSDGYVNSILEKIKAAPDYAKAFLLELAEGAVLDTGNA